MDKEFILGTAMWGWSVSEKECHKILDYFYNSGYRKIDTAKNYPINSVTEDYLKSEQIIKNWITSRQVNDLQLIYKVGSLSNEYSPINNLSEKFIESEFDRIIKKFGNNLFTLMVHWDNRNDKLEIKKTIEILLKCNPTLIGLSGIKFPEIYNEILFDIGYQNKILVEIKFNILSTESLIHYSKLNSHNTEFIAYSIASGGIKIDKNEYEKNSRIIISQKPDFHEKTFPNKIKLKIEELIQKHEYLLSFYDLSLLFVYFNVSIDKIILGPRTKEQLENSFKLIDLYKNQEKNFSDLYNS